MDIHVLRYFLAVAREGNVTKAADFLHLTQPTQLNKTYSVQGFGKNPSLASAQSKTDKNINGLSKSSQTNELVYFSYANTSAIAVGATETQVSSVRFTNDKATTIETWTEIQLETTLGAGQTSMQVQAYYYLDGVLVAYSPIETYTDSAKHILGLHWFQFINEVMPHTWVVKLRATNGTVDIDMNNVHTLLKGQGLNSEQAWDGTITVEDVVGYAYLEGLYPSTISSNLTVQFQVPRPITLDEVVGTSELNLDTSTKTDETDVDIRYVDMSIYLGEGYSEGSYLSDILI